MPGENQFNAFNYLVPATGTVSGFNVQNVFTAALNYSKNFEQLAVDAAEFHPSGVFVDNTNGIGALVVTIRETGQQIVTPAGAVKQVQYPAPMNHTAFIASQAGALETGLASVTFVDFPVMPFESTYQSRSAAKGISAKGTVDGTGTQVVAAAGKYLTHLTVQNTDAANKLYLSFTNPATNTDFVLGAGLSMTFPNNGFGNTLYGLSNAATTAFATIGA